MSGSSEHWCSDTQTWETSKLTCPKKEGEMIFLDLMAMDRLTTSVSWILFSLFIIKKIYVPSICHTKRREEKKHAIKNDWKRKSYHLIVCLPPPPHAQQPMLGTSLWDNRLKQVLEQGRQSGARDVIRGDLRASDWAESASLGSWCRIWSFTEILQRYYFFLSHLLLSNMWCLHRFNKYILAELISNCKIFVLNWGSFAGEKIMFSALL